MKNIKKIFSALLVFVLAIFAVNTVNAETVTGSITVNKTVAGKTYEIYKIFDLTYSGSNVAYTIDENWVAFFEGAGSSYISSTNTGNLNPITIGTTTKYINITNDNIVEFTQKALAYAASVDADATDVAEGETLVFSGLALGYYLVYPQGATEKNDANGSIASINSTMKDAVVNVKAKYPEITKTVNEHSFDVGEYAQFTITGKVPDTTGFTTYTYEISDTWTAGLELDTTKVNFLVKIGETPITSVAPVYTANGFTLTFDMVNFQELNKESLVGKTITVTYNLKVTKDAINSTETKNSATLTYSTNPKTKETTTTTPVEEYVYSSKIVVTKVDGKDNTTTLAGATFVLKGSEGYYKEVKNDNGLVEVQWVSTIDEATKLTTGEDGIISFEGLKNGSYELIETEAPLGYNKLPNPVKVSISGDYDKNKKPIPSITRETVANNTGTQLPSTGGFGTTMFIMIGSLLALLSAIVLVTNKRMAKEYL